jgi:hypothetical protein
MDRPDDTCKARSGRNQHAADAPSSALPTHLQQRIEAQRTQLLHAHGVLRCLHEVLLHALSFLSCVSPAVAAASRHRQR